MVVIEYYAYSSQDRKHWNLRSLEHEIGLLTSVPVEHMDIELERKSRSVDVNYISWKITKRQDRINI
jgi:hypothetical protein